MTDGTTPLLAYNIWLALPVETRSKLVKLFNIPRTGEVIVRSGTMINGNIASEVTSDGHSAKDLYAITVEKMQEFTGSKDSDFYKLFNKVVEKTENKPVIVVVETDNPQKPFKVTEVIGEPRKPKHAKPTPKI